MTFGNYIGGEWTPAQGGAIFERRNPADTTDLVGEYADSGGGGRWRRRSRRRGRALPAWRRLGARCAGGVSV